MTTATAAQAEELDIRTYRIPASDAADVVPTYVLLHGIGLSHRIFTRLGRTLSRSGNVISFDLPGFGPTRRPGRQLSVEDHATIILDQLDRLDTGPVVLVGHSMGAQFALEIARQNPALVTHLVLVGPVVDAAHRTLRTHFVRLLRDAALEPARTQLVVLFDYIRCGIPWFLVQAAAMRDYPTNDRITDITQPVLVVRGQNDPIAGHDWSERLLRRSGGPGTLVTIPGKRHNVVHSEPAGVAAALSRFVNDQI